MPTTKQKPDYDRKSQVLAYSPYPGWNIVELYRLISRLDFYTHAGKNPSQSLVRDVNAFCYGTKTKSPVWDNLTPDQVFSRPDELISWFTDEFDFILRDLRLITNADHERNKRLKKRVADILLCGDEPCFITFTFNNDTLSKRNPDSRRQAVRRYLNSKTNLYVANIDFGAENGREHYHAVCDCNPGNTWDTELNYGFIKIEPVRIDETATTERLSRYVSKLSNHAIKETTKRNVLIYSR